MKLIGGLKKKVEAAQTKEAKKDIIAQAGMELTDDELDVATGGINNNLLTVKHKCNNCGKETTFNLYSGGRAVCTVCGNKTTL